MKGIAVAPILFVVAILAVLVGALSSGSGGLGSDVSPERAKILASQIIQQANIIRDAVQRVRANGCADSEISFENGVVSGYTNPNAPLSTKSWCHIFQPNGGGASSYPTISGNGVRRQIFNYCGDNQNSSPSFWMVHSIWAMPGQGTTSTVSGSMDLALTGFVAEDTCAAVNNIVFGTTAIPVLNGGSPSHPAQGTHNFVGGYTPGSSPVMTCTGEPDCTGASVICVARAYSSSCWPYTGYRHFVISALVAR